ncbi:MAG TPA: hypothetical protein VFX35_01450 [Solirubrobacterales bacterium]|nr:hypothetical protein [Solirubrobacterales bacterium]
MIFAVEVSYTRGPELRQNPNRCIPCESVEEAAQVFDSEAGTGQPLSEIVEELSLKGRVEFEEDDHPWRLIVAYELVEAVA